MRKLLIGLSLLFYGSESYTQSGIPDSAFFLLHKWQQPIGREKYILVKQGGTITYHVEFKYIDRGSPVQLNDSMVFTSAMDPVYYRIRGGTSRFSKVDDSVVFQGPKKFQ